MPHRQRLHEFLGNIHHILKTSANWLKLEKTRPVLRPVFYSLPELSVRGS